MVINTSGIDGLLKLTHYTPNRCRFIYTVAQLVEHCTGITEVTGLNLELLYFRRLFCNCLNYHHVSFSQKALHAVSTNSCNYNIIFFLTVTGFLGTNFCLKENKNGVTSKYLQAF